MRNPLGRIFQALPLDTRAKLAGHWAGVLQEALAKNAADLAWLHHNWEEFEPRVAQSKQLHLDMKRARLEEWQEATAHTLLKIYVLLEVEKLTRESAD